MSCYCINPSDTNKTLEATFRFIYQNQKAPNNTYYTTYIYLALTETSNINYENYNDRKVALNAVVGKIIEVKQTYCKIETISLCENETQIYTISYNEMENIISEVLFKYSNEYVQYMNRLPELCFYCEDRNYSLLKKLEKVLSKLKQSESLYLIYAGIFSAQYTKENFSIIKNLIYINKDGIVPINFLSGFFIVDSDNESNGRSN